MQPVPGGNGTGDIREFEYQNGWLLFAFLIITLGIYVPFWMLRTAVVVNKLLPDLSIKSYLPKVLLMGLFVNLFNGFLVGILQALKSPSAETANILSNILSFGISIYELVLVFQFRGALNKILERTSPRLRYFGGVGTFFFGILYLQIRLNQRMKEREAEIVR
jgi:hypothetical protein